MIVAAILAAGTSRRLGRPKQLLPFEGTTLLRAITARVCASSCDRIAVVLGACSDHIAPVLDGLDLTILANPWWPEGIASSIRAAAAWAWRVRADGLALLVGDQPRLTTAHVDLLCDTFRHTGRSVGSRYAGIIGVPAVFDAAELPRLIELSGDTGARCVLADSQPAIVEWPDGAEDIDEPAQLTRSS